MPYQCKFCEKTFSRGYNLDRHLDLMHSDASSVNESEAGTSGYTNKKHRMTNVNIPLNRFEENDADDEVSEDESLVSIESGDEINVQKRKFNSSDNDQSDSDNEIVLKKKTVKVLEHATLLAETTDSMILLKNKSEKLFACKED